MVDFIKEVQKYVNVPLKTGMTYNLRSLDIPSSVDICFDQMGERRFWCLWDIDELIRPYPFGRLVNLIQNS